MFRVHGICVDQARSLIQTDFGVTLMTALRITIILGGLLTGYAAATASPVPSAPNGEDLMLARTLNHTAEFYLTQGEYEEARRLYLRSLPLLEKALGPEDPGTVTTLGNLCVASSRMTAYIDSKPLCARALALREKLFGPNHPEVARSLSDLGVLYAKEGDLSRAEPLLRRASEIVDSLPDFDDRGALFNNLGFLYFKKKKCALAKDMFERAVHTTEKDHGPDALELAPILNNLANVYLANHQARAAEALFRRALSIAEMSIRPDPISGGLALVGLARAGAAQGRRLEAQTFLQQAENVAEQNRLGGRELNSAIEAAYASLPKSKR